MNDGLVTCGQPACTNLGLGGSVQSAFVGSEGVTDTCDDDCLGDKCGKESAPGARWPVDALLDQHKPDTNRSKRERSRRHLETSGLVSWL